MTSKNNVRARLWRRGVERYGRLKWYSGIVLMPIWLPIYHLLRVVSAGLRKLGDLGDWLEQKL